MNTPNHISPRQFRIPPHRTGAIGKIMATCQRCIGDGVRFDLDSRNYIDCRRCNGTGMIEKQQVRLY